jgi:hypothetical protein
VSLLTEAHSKRHATLVLLVTAAVLPQQLLLQPGVALQSGWTSLLLSLWCLIQYESYCCQLCSLWRKRVEQACGCARGAVELEVEALAAPAHVDLRQPRKILNSVSAGYACSSAAWLSISRGGHKVGAQMTGKLP